MLSLQELILSLVFLAITSLIVYHFLLLRSDPNEPPLVKGPLPFLGCAMSLQRNFKSFLLESRTKHGDIFTIYVAGQRIHIIADPVDGIPTLFRNRNFGFDDFSNTMRKKQFLNTVDELKDASMTKELHTTAMTLLLSVDATSVLVDRLLAHSEPTLKQMVDSVGYEWKEVNLIDWCCRFVFELSNTALMGPNFPKDDEFYQDLMKFDNNLVTVWKTPEMFLWKEQAIARRLVRRIQTFWTSESDVCEFVRARVEAP